MKKQIISLLILLSFSSSHTYSSEHFWKPAKDGDKIILIRHALAPGGGDPEGFNIKDCRTQRNLNEIGINQSKKIGKLFNSLICFFSFLSKGGLKVEFNAENSLNLPNAYLAVSLHLHH